MSMNLVNVVSKVLRIIVLFWGEGGGRSLTNMELYLFCQGASSPKLGLSTGNLLLPEERKNEMKCRQIKIT